MKTEELSGPELGRAALEAVGWKISAENDKFIESPDGRILCAGSLADDPWRWLFRYQPNMPRPHWNAGDADALLLEWLSKVGECERYYEVRSPSRGWREGKQWKCGLQAIEYPYAIAGYGDTREEAICRALVRWNRSLNRDESLTTDGAEGGD